MKHFNKHTIQSGETLQTIANLYDLHKDDLIMFHNNRSNEIDKLLINLRHQKELFLPRTAVLNKSKLLKFGTL